ncbi:MFS transporter [Caballeronia sp. 15711]|uniref:MFS transporter n=1 Tax=Caballeronia sp. 15711 TaxID=3391029 RepID=UPI0039E5BC56
MNECKDSVVSAVGDATPERKQAAWAAVCAMMLGVLSLVTAEFLPMSLLTPMARDLGVSEGTAGQAVTVTAFTALVASLLVATITRRFNRRPVLLIFSVLLIASDLLVANATNLAMLLMGRLLLGVALGGFWTMAAATTTRLVPSALVPRALAIVMSGIAGSSILSGPVGSAFGNVVGWRGVFVMAAGLGGLALVIQIFTLPSLEPRGQARFGTLIEILQRPRLGLGMAAATLVFAGHYALLTYIRPFLETITGVGVPGISAILLGFGVANYLGTFVGGALTTRNLGQTLAAMPLVIATLGLLLATFGGLAPIDAVMIALWGLAFGGVPVAWTTWITRLVPDETESGTGIFIAAAFLGISMGAAGGGVVYDFGGARSVMIAGAATLIIAVLIVNLRLKVAAAATTQRQSAG